MKQRNMKIAVIDDERPSRSEMQFLLKTLFPEADIVEASSAKEAAELFTRELFEVIFLDINLGDLNGTVLASILKKDQPQAALVFVTAYEEYAVRAFELDALDYILKPFDLGRLEKTVEKLKRAGYLQPAEPAQAVAKIAVHGGDRIVLLCKNEILYVESDRKVCRIFTKDAVYEETITMLHMEQKLSEQQFFRIQKSYLVNLNYVEELVPNYNNGYAVRMKYRPEPLLPIGRSQIKVLRSMFQL